MPVSTTEKTALTQAHQVLADLISALVVDPVPHPLEAALAAMTAERDAAIASAAALQAKLDASKAHLDAAAVADAAGDIAEASEDAARIAARQALE